MNKERDKKWSRAIKERDNHTCKWCGMHGNDPAHILGRRYLLLRWVLENGICLCRKCHSRFDTVRLFREHVIKVVIGEELYNKLKGVIKDAGSKEKAGFKEVN